MKKRILAIIMALVICFGLNESNKMLLQAEEYEEDIDFSYLLTEDTLVGHMETQTWGVYLAEGNSFINKMSSTKIGAGGITGATVKCQVSVTSIVERQTSTGWAWVTSWTQTNPYAFSAAISKSYTVGSGYNYRVRSLHYAGTDGSSSCTDALVM